MRYISAIRDAIIKISIYKNEQEGSVKNKFIL